MDLAINSPEVTVTFDKASTDAFIVIVTTLRYVNNLNQEVAEKANKYYVAFCSRRHC